MNGYFAPTPLNEQARNISARLGKVVIKSAQIDTIIDLQTRYGGITPEFIRELDYVTRKAEDDAAAWLALGAEDIDPRTPEERERDLLYTEQKETEDSVRP
jgi:hypothetical protein